jgi:hypothetical protein
VDHAESIAKRLLEAILIGARMEYRLSQSQGQHDFDLHHPDGTVSAVEVTSAVNKTVVETNASIRDPKKDGPMVKTRLCKKDWLVHPASTANINLIRSRVDEYLAAIESAAIERFYAPADLRNPSVERIYLDLGVVAGSVFPYWKEPGQIGIEFPGGGGPLNPRAATDAAEREAFKSDNRRKLGAAGTNGRHLVVYVYVTNYLPWCALCDLDPPPDLPRLPPEITDLWLLSETGSEHEYVVWHGSASLRWHSRRLLVRGGA